MNVAEQAYQDGQQYRKTSGLQLAGEALENQAMEAFPHSRLAFHDWQLSRDNWIAGYQAMQDEPKEEEAAPTAEETTYTLVASGSSGGYVLDDAEGGRALSSGDALAILLSGQWIPGSIAYTANLYGIESAPHRLYSGYYFLDHDGNVCGLCAGMKVRLG